MGETRQVIIGNSAAALAAIKGIREVDRLCSITVISGEDCNAYSPVLTTYYLKGRISREDLFVVDKGFYEAQGVKTIFGRKAVEVDPSGQSVRLEDGVRVPYDNLLIATGASPLELGGPEKPDNVFSLRTIRDAEKIMARAGTAEDIVLIGAGLVSLQVGDALFKKGIRLTILEQATQVLPATIDGGCAAMVQKEMESLGITVLPGERVRTIGQEGRKAVVVSDSGREVPADMVVVGIGVRPNADVVKNSGIERDRGVLVDDTLRTNIGNVFAAGDVSQGKNAATGKREVLPNWINACRQGRTAGLNMAGFPRKYGGGLRETITTIFGVTLVAVGLIGTSEGGDEEVRFINAAGKVYRKMVLSGNRVVGSVLMGGVKDGGILRSLISNRRDFSSFKKTATWAPVDIRRSLFSVIGRGDVDFRVS